MLLAKQSTVRITIVGPILDSAGAEYASAVIGDLSISKNGGTLTALASAATLVYIANGMYTLTLTTGNTDTLGAIEISCNKSTYQMRQKELQIVPAMIYDSIVAGTDVLQADVTQLLGTVWLTPAVAGTPDVNTKTIAADAVDATSLAVSAVTEIQSGLATAANLATVAGYLDTEISAILADTNELQTDWANGGRLDLILDIIAADTTTDIPALIDALPTATENFTAVVTTALTESYAADGEAPTVAQALLLIQQALTEFTISGTTTTVKKLDGSTTAATLTLNDGTTPTGVTRAT